MTEDSLSKTLNVLNESIGLSKKFDPLFKPSPIDALFAHQREAEERERKTLKSLSRALEAEERRKAELIAEALARKIKPEAEPPEPPQEKLKKSREHELHEVLRRAHSVLKLTAKPLLKELKNPKQRERFDPERVIISVADNGIHFYNRREEKSDFMTRRCYNNFVSGLNTGKR